jgi:transposase
VQVVRLGEIVLIHDLKRQGLSVSAIARQVGLDRKTVRRHLARGLEPPAYGPRAPRPTLIAPFEDYLATRVAAYPELSGKRLLREIREMGYAGSYTRLTDFVRGVRPPRRPVFERRSRRHPAARPKWTSPSSG